MNAMGKITKLIIESTVNHINAEFYTRYGNENVENFNAEMLHELTKQIEIELFDELKEK